MPGDTSSGRDVSVMFSIPVIVSGEECKPECRTHGAPWGAPSKVSLAQEILARTGALLELLQAAQRDGLLSDVGLCDLEAIERFHSALSHQLHPREQ